jgi:predicted transcriptional regulator
MQLLLPIFPREAKLINDHVGVYEHDGLVQYLVNGLPVYCHTKEDINAFRFITSNFIHQGICRKVDIERSFGVSEDSVSRAYKKFVEKGEAGFFGDDARRGKAHKINGERRQRIQSKLDKGQSVYSIAKEEGVRESAIRYGVKQGYLKKRL